MKPRHGIPTLSRNKYIILANSKVLEESPMKNKCKLLQFWPIKSLTRWERIYVLFVSESTFLIWLSELILHLIGSQKSIASVFFFSPTGMFQFFDIMISFVTYETISYLMLLLCILSYILSFDCFGMAIRYTGTKKHWHEKLLIVFLGLDLLSSIILALCETPTRYPMIGSIVFDVLLLPYLLIFISAAKRKSGNT